jgi:hypothetical protein
LRPRRAGPWGRSARCRASTRCGARPRGSGEMWSLSLALGCSLIVCWTRPAGSSGVSEVQMTTPIVSSRSSGTRRARPTRTLPAGDRGAAAAHPRPARAQRLAGQPSRALAQRHRRHHRAAGRRRRVGRHAGVRPTLRTDSHRPRTPQSPGETDGRRRLKARQRQAPASHRRVHAGVGAPQGSPIGPHNLGEPLLREVPQARHGRQSADQCVRRRDRGFRARARLAALFVPLFLTARLPWVEAHN